jgi:hypothetical protein
MDDAEGDPRHAVLAHLRFRQRSEGIEARATPGLRMQPVTRLEDASDQQDTHQPGSRG